MDNSDGPFIWPAEKYKRIEKRDYPSVFRRMAFDEKHSWGDMIFSCKIKAGKSLFYCGKNDNSGAV